LLLAKDLDYENDQALTEDLDEVARLLESYRSKIVASAQ
jgi:hypothetical protein